MAGTSASSTTEDLEAARTRIRARLALAFVLDDVDVAGRAARLAAIVGATQGSTRPLDAAAAQRVLEGAARVEVPALVEAALAHAGAAREDGRRLVRAVAWLEGRLKAHTCDVLVVEALSRTSDTPARAAIERALGGAKRAEWLAAGVEHALSADRERKEQATDARGQLLYLDSLGRPTTERCERVARSLRSGEPLYAPPPGAGFTAAEAAFTDDELWRVHFANVPHGERRLREWTLDPLHRAFDDRPRAPVERPAQAEPDVVHSRAADLASVLAYADAARTALLALPTLAAHEPLFVDAVAANEIAQAACAALAAVGRVVAITRERIDALVPQTQGADDDVPAPDDADCEFVPTAAWPLVFSLTGGPLPARIAAVRTLVESLPTGLAPAPTELDWPEPSIREPVLDALAGSDRLRICALDRREIPGAVGEILDVIAAAQRTQRRAYRALSALSNARPALEPPSVEDAAAASEEAARLATELVARSVAETARTRFAQWTRPALSWHALEHPAFGDELLPSAGLQIVLGDHATLASAVHPQVHVVHRLADALEWSLPARKLPRLALMTLGAPNTIRGQSTRTAWLALLRVARSTDRSVYTDRGLPENLEKLDTVIRITSGDPCAITVGPGLDEHAHVVGWALIDAIDDWNVRMADIVILPESLRLAQDLANEHQVELRERQVRLIALAGDLATAHPVELTSPVRTATSA